MVRPSYDDAGRPRVARGGEPHKPNRKCPSSARSPRRIGARPRWPRCTTLNTRRWWRCWAPYDGADPRIAGTSTYPPGAKENGGIFCHANTWVIIAAVMLGQPDRAYEYYRQILPLARTDADRFRVEPYVYCQNICGPTHPQFGLGRNAWLTGTASWAYVAATQWILVPVPLKPLRITPPSRQTGPATRKPAASRRNVHITVTRGTPAA